LKTAAGLSPYLVFPFREESIPMYQWADKSLPGDWKAKYYLSLVYWGLRRQTEARELLAACANQPDYAPFYLCRAFLENTSDPAQALADYQKAHAVGPDDWRNWQRLAMAYADRGMNDKALELAVEASRRFPDEDLIKILLARTYLDNGRYQECYSILENATILPFEGQRDVHQLYVQCQICLAIQAMKQSRNDVALKYLQDSREFPARLGTGKPQDPDYRIQDYLTMLAYQSMGNSAKAEEAYQKVVAYSSRRSRGGTDTARAQVDEWYRSVFRSQNELDALRELAKRIQGSGRRRP
jgi:tetratricopeptide (TPR) repeat protein